MYCFLFAYVLQIPREWQGSCQRAQFNEVNNTVNITSTLEVPTGQTKLLTKQYKE